MTSSPDKIRIVAIPGFGGAGGDYEPLSRRLPDYEWHALTWPGCAGVPYDRPQIYMPEHLSNWLCSTVRPNDVVLGYSMGRRLALQSLARGLSCRALIVVAATPGIRSITQRAARKEADEALAMSVINTGAEAFYERWAQHPLIRTQARIEAPFYERMRARRKMNDSHVVADALRCFGQGSLSPVWTGVVQSTLPVLLVTGSEDAKYTMLLRELAAQWQTAEHVVLEAGHAAHLENADAMAQEVERFLNRVVAVDRQ